MSGLERSNVLRREKFRTHFFERRRMPELQKKGFVYFLGSAVMHGNPYSPAADTEVDHYYECENCRHEWTVYT